MQRSPVHKPRPYQGDTVMNADSIHGNKSREDQERRESNGKYNLGRSNSKKRKSVTEGSGGNKKARPDNNVSTEVEEEVFVLEDNNTANNTLDGRETCAGNVTVNKLLKSEAEDLVKRFKLVEEIIAGHAEDKKDNQLKNMISMLKLSNNKLREWSELMIKTLEVKISDKACHSVDNKMTHPRSVNFAAEKRRVSDNDWPSVQSSHFKDINGNKDDSSNIRSNGNKLHGKRRTSIRNSFVGDNNYNLHNNGLSANKVSAHDNNSRAPLYSTIVADSLAQKKELLNLPKTVGRPVRITAKDKKDRISMGMEKSSRAITILDYNFNKKLNSRDMMLKVLNNDLISFLRNKILQGSDEDLVEDDIYSLNDAIDAITLIEFRGNATLRKTVQDKDNENYSINTIPINIFFANRTQKNTFEKYLRIFAKHIRCVPYWHPAILGFKESIFQKTRENSNDKISLRILNKHVISGSRKNAEGKWIESFVFDPLDGRYFLSDTDSEGNFRLGSAKYREEKNMNKYWVIMRNEYEESNSSSGAGGNYQSESNANE